MKIIQTNKAYFPKVGGIETTITTLSEGLVKDFNAEVTALVFNEKRSFKTISKSIEGVKVNYLPNFGSIASLPISFSYFDYIKKLNGDILHIHEPFPWADLAIKFLPQVKNNFSKIIVSWHSDIIRQKWVLSIYRKYIYNLLNIADQIIVSNASLIDNSSFLRAFRKKCNIIPIGTNLNWTNNLSVTNNLKLNDGKKSILFVGRLVYYKGIEYLVQAMSSIKNAELTIIGSGPLKNKIIQQINSLNLGNRICVVPEVDSQTLHKHFNDCDLFVLPSVEKSETYGIVQIEAMACGKPVISTELGTGTSFVNQDKLTGFVVPPRDSNSLKDAINKLVENDDLRLNLGRNAKLRAFNEFTAEIMVKRIYHLYESLLNK